MDLKIKKKTLKLAYTNFDSVSIDEIIRPAIFAMVR